MKPFVTIESICAVSLPVIIASLAARFAARWAVADKSKNNSLNNSGIGIDDWTALVSGLISITGIILLLICSHLALGRPLSSSTLGDIETVLLLVEVDQVLFLLCSALTKISILVRYIRLVGSHAISKEHRRFRQASGILVIAITVVTVVMIIALFCLCKPAHFFWTRVGSGGKGGQCDGQLEYWYCNAAFCIVMDIAVIVLPVRWVRRMNMTAVKKLTICALFGLGAL